MAVSGEILAGLLGFSLVEKAGDTLDKIFESVFGGESVKDLLRDGADRFSAATGKIPPNHDLERTIRACELLATRTLLTRYAQEKERERLARGGLWNEPFVDAAQSWLGEQLGLPGASPKPDHELVAELEARIDEALSARTLPELRAALAEPQRRVWRELTHGAAGRDAWRAPDDFKAMFDGDGGEARPGWALVFVALMREALKSNDKTKVAFLATRLSALRPLQERMAAKLDALAEVAVRTEKKIDRLSDEVVAKLVAALDTRADRRTIIDLAQRLRPEETLNFEQAIVELENAVETRRNFIARGRRGTNEGEFLDNVLARLAALAERNDYDEGAREVDAALAELAEQEEAFRRQRHALLEAGVELDSLRRDAAAVARRIEAIAAQEHPGERPAWTTTFRESWDRYYEEGSQKGVNFSLEIAIALARSMAEQAGDADERGAAGNLLGIALQELGARESGTERLEQAVAALSEALKEYTRERVPLAWAGTQNNLANALRALGDLESGTERLKQAIAACRDALKVWTRKHNPRDWAMAQSNLGSALAVVGERENRTDHLKEAIVAFNEALKVYSHERFPLEWAMMQNNLGNALSVLGERESGTRCLAKAVAAYLQALKERTRERVPLYWAMTQFNLGRVFFRLGERESGTDFLEKAIVAYSESLREQTRERVPLAWAKTLTNLGAALTVLGDRAGRTDCLEEAVVAFRGALTVFTREASPDYFDGTQRNLSYALALLEERRKAGGG
jgi:tetratricopeptide (TPR) repeat protein